MRASKLLSLSLVAHPMGLRGHLVRAIEEVAEDFGQREHVQSTAVVIMMTVSRVRVVLGLDQQDGLGSDEDLLQLVAGLDEGGVDPDVLRDRAGETDLG